MKLLCDTAISLRDIINSRVQFILKLLFMIIKIKKIWVYIIHACTKNHTIPKEIHMQQVKVTIFQTYHHLAIIVPKTLAKQERKNA